MNEWIWQIAITKAVKVVIQVVLGWLIAHGIESWGIKIDEAQLTLAFIGALEVLRNHLKLKYKWSWL